MTQKTIAAKSAEDFRFQENGGGENFFSFVQQQQGRNSPGQGLADCRIRLHGYGELVTSLITIKQISELGKVNFG
jgi:hypothetical protein